MQRGAPSPRRPGFPGASMAPAVLQAPGAALEHLLGGVARLRRGGFHRTNQVVPPGRCHRISGHGERQSKGACHRFARAGEPEGAPSAQRESDQPRRRDRASARRRARPSAAGAGARDRGSPVARLRGRRRSACAGGARRSSASCRCRGRRGSHRSATPSPISESQHPASITSPGERWPCASLNVVFSR